MTCSARAASSSGPYTSAATATGCSPNPPTGASGSEPERARLAALAAKAAQPVPEVPDRPLVELLGIQRADLDVVGRLASAAAEPRLEREAARPVKPSVLRDVATPDDVQAVLDLWIERSP